MRHSIPRDGLISGTLGATAVAAWFLVLDSMRGAPFFTPNGLGHALLSVLRVSPDNPAALFVVAYTVFHYAAFIIVGTIAAAIVHWADRQPGVLAGGFLLFVTAEAGFYGMTAVLAESPMLGVVAWPEVAVGNSLAALLMGTYLWRTHPALGRGLDLALSGRSD